jgi:hypothetical protein
VTLTGTKTGDAGLDHLRGNASLDTLVLADTGVTDAGLALVAGFKRLRHANLKGTRVTAAGVEGLRKALPHCQIEWDGPTIEPPAPKAP